MHMPSTRVAVAGASGYAGGEVLRLLLGHPEDGGSAECVESAADEEVVRPEVVAPHADAVHLVDDDEADVDPRDGVEKVPLSEPLGCDVEEPVAALCRSAQPRGGLVRVER